MELFSIADVDGYRCKINEVTYKVTQEHGDHKHHKEEKHAVGPETYLEEVLYWDKFPIVQVSWEHSCI